MTEDEDDFAGQEFNADDETVEEPEPEVEETEAEEAEVEDTEEVVEETTDEVEETQETEDEGSDEDFDKPVSEGDIVDVEVEDLGSKGDGIARVEGFVVFVPGAEVDTTYEVEVTSVGNKFAFAEIVE
ncbi:MAG: TRAM domain-containing protein [Candidatus Nanohaloarchaea archaeon]